MAHQYIHCFGSESQILPEVLIQIWIRIKLINKILNTA
jgi:hypothetical protein